MHSLGDIFCGFRMIQTWAGIDERFGITIWTIYVVVASVPRPIFSPTHTNRAHRPNDDVNGFGFISYFVWKWKIASAINNNNSQLNSHFLCVSVCDVIVLWRWGLDRRVCVRRTPNGWTSKRSRENIHKRTRAPAHIVYRKCEIRCGPIVNIICRWQYLFFATTIPSLTCNTWTCSVGVCMYVIWKPHYRRPVPTETFSRLLNSPMDTCIRIVNHTSLASSSAPPSHSSQTAHTGNSIIFNFFFRFDYSDSFHPITMPPRSSLSLCLSFIR